MTNIALLVGIDAYPKAPLAGCVNDAIRMHTLLYRHHDSTPNFECKKLVAPSDDITKETLQSAMENLFLRQADVALFYFAGHGTVNNLGGFLVTPEARKYNEGLRMTDILQLANDSPAKERIVILDCCHSGAMGQLPALENDQAMLKEGVSILSACREAEVSVEKDGGGLFTSLICDALSGGAADVCGKVTIASIYAYADEILGGWDQRPLFKSHVSKLVPLRICEAAVDIRVLRLLPQYFKSPTDDLPLSPSYEPTLEPPCAQHEEIFSHLQKLRAARLVVPVGEEHLYFAALKSKPCRLTPLGIFYWHLANKGKI